MTATALGSPAFTLDGNILGVDVMRSIGSGDEGMNNFRSDGMTSIVLPAEDILKASKQAPEAKGDTVSDDSKPATDGSKSTNNVAEPAK